MKKGMHVLFLYLLLIVSFAITGVQTSEAISTEPVPQVLKPLWSATYLQGIDAIAVSPDAGFVGVVTSTQISLLDINGKEIWSIAPEQISPYLRPTALAIGPGGRWVIIAGDPSYRYIWRVNRDGSRWFFKTVGTPRTIAVTRSGDLIAVGTAGGHLYLLDQHGHTIRDISLDFDLIENLKFSDDDKYIVICSAWINGVLSRSGKFRWRSKIGWYEIHPSRNLKYFGALSRTAHGPPASGVAMLDEKGKELWSRALWSGDIRIAPSGEYAVISGIPIAQDTQIWDPQTWPQELDSASVSIIDQKGTTVRERSLPSHGLGFITSDSRTIALFFSGRIMGFNLHLEPVWIIEPPGSFIYLPPSLLFTYTYNNSHHRLSAFRLPTEPACNRK